MALPTSLSLNIVTPDQSFVHDVDEVSLPGAEGDFGVLPGHTPLLTRIKAGTVRVKMQDGSEELVFVAGGMLEVQPNLVTVLADTAIRGKDLDEAKSLESKKRAEEAMQNKTSQLEYAKAQAELAEAIAQLAAIQKLRKRH